MIKDYFSSVEEKISGHPLVVNLSFNSTVTDEERGFWKAELVFRDGSKLYLFEYIIGSEVEKYRYHYQDGEDKLVFRFDDAPHHSELGTAPDHKHDGSEVVEAEKPELQEVLDLVAENFGSWLEE